MNPRLAFLFVLVCACGDDTAKPPATEVADTSVPEETFVPDDTVVPEQDTYVEEDVAPPPSNKLTYGTSMVGSNGQTCTSSCALRTDAGEPVELLVQYKTGEGKPLNDRMISFSFVDEIPADVATLSAFSAYTDDNGVARITVRSYDLAGSFMVRARQSSDSGAGELQFAVTLDVPPPPALAVSIDYLGVAGVAEFKLKVFKQVNGQPSCASVYPDGIDGTRAPDLSQGPYIETQQMRVTELPGLAQVFQQKYVVQVVAPFEGAPVASGCVEVEATYNQTAGAQVFVLDLPRHFDGDFRATTRLNIVDGATGTAHTILTAITDLFTRPGYLLLTTACANPPDGLLATACNWLMDDGEPGIIGGFVTDVLDAALLGLLESAIGEEAQDATFYISEMLQQLQLISIMRFEGEPASPHPGFDGAYWAPGAVTEEWTTARFRWKLDPACKQSAHPEDCGWATIPLSSVYGSNPKADLSAGIDANLNLYVDMHDVPALKYGPLINAIIERYILPLTVSSGSQPINTWDKLIGRIFAGGSCGSNAQCCQKFADRIYDDVPDYLYEVAPGACEIAIPLLAAGIRYAMSQLESSLHLGTPEGAGCPSTDTDLDRFVEGYGQLSVQCEWELYFPTGAGDFYPDTDWRAVRQ